MTAELDALTARVDALEQQAAQQSLDTIQPNYLTLATDGTVGASFTGLINALGLILPANVTGGPAPAQSEVIWNELDGSLVASIVANDAGPGFYSLNLSANPNATPGIQSSMALSAQSAGHRAILGINGQTAHGSVRATVDANTATILDEAAASSFLQLGLTRRAVVSWGIVSAGAVIDAGSGDWAIVGSAPGQTQLAFTSGGGGGAFVACTPLGGAVAGTNFTAFATNASANPIVQGMQNGTLTSIDVLFIALHL